MEPTWRATPATPAWDENRARILEAASREVRAVGFLKLRVERIAAAAGCSRATLYRYFQDKDALVRAVLTQRAEKLAGALELELAGLDEPAELIAEGILRSVDAIRRDAWFRSLAEPGAAARVVRLAGGPQALAGAIAPLLRPLLAAAANRGRGFRPEVSPAEAAEWLMLVVIGMLTMNLPLSRTRAEQASFLRRFVAYTLLGPPPKR